MINIKINNDIIGYCIYYFTKSKRSCRLNNSTTKKGRQNAIICNISILITKKSFQKMGLASALIELIKIEAIKKSLYLNYEMAIIRLEPSEKKYVKFYKKRGFFDNGYKGGNLLQTKDAKTCLLNNK